MLRNNVKIALRNLTRHRGYALINLLGLAVGMACFLLIALYVWDEGRYDHFHEQGDRIYRVDTDWGGDPFAVSAMQLAPALQDEFTEVERAVRLLNTEFLLAAGTRRFQENDLFYADSTVFEVFTFPFVQGDPETALTAPFSLVLTESTARKYFGTDDPMGRVLRADNTHDFTVTGVVRDVPAASHLRFDALVSMTTADALLPPGIWDDWFWSEAYTYVLLAEPGAAEAAALQARLPAFEKRHMAAAAAETGVERYTHHLEALPDLYLNSTVARPIGPTGNRTNYYLFSVVAVFILLMACFNFMNLATARSTERAREVGVRKTMGALRAQLAAQFLSESVLLALASMLLALLLAELALPAFEALTGKAFSGQILIRPGVVLALVGLAVLVGLLGGSYPAAVLSRFNPTAVLKGGTGPRGQGTALRRGLTVFQFSLSIMLIAGTLVVFGQHAYLRSRDLGFDKEHLLVLSYDGDAFVQQNLERIKAAFLQHPAVLNATSASDTPGLNQYSSRVVYEGRKGEMEVGYAKLYFVDHDFIDTYRIELIAGRGFSEAFATDTAAAMIVNRRATRVYGFERPEDIVGKRFRQWGQEGVIVGVVKDFNFTSLHDHIRAFSMRIDPSETRFLVLRLQTDDLQQTLADLEATWQELVPYRPFDFSFQDDRLDRLYSAEARFGRVFGVFAALALFIAGLGLFGLASYTTARRTKEIGVRKVLGASTHQIIVLLSRDFAALVGVAFVVAVPPAYYGLGRWLDGFAYRIDLGAVTFLEAGGLALVIALASVGYRAARAASADPVDSLRYE